MLAGQGGAVVSFAFLEDSFGGTVDNRLEERLEAGRPVQGERCQASSALWQGLAEPDFLTEPTPSLTS